MQKAHKIIRKHFKIKIIFSVSNILTIGNISGLSSIPIHCQPSNLKFARVNRTITIKYIYTHMYIFGNTNPTTIL